MIYVTTTDSSVILAMTHSVKPCDQVTGACAGLLATVVAAGAEGDMAAAGETKLGRLWNMRMFDESEPPWTPFIEPCMMYHQVCISAQALTV